MKRVVAASAVIFAFSAAFAFPAGPLKPPAPEGLWPKVTGAAELAASQVFCMTPGTATNDFSTLPFRNLEGEYYYVKPE